MDYLKITSLPKILSPRKGRLSRLHRSQCELTENEVNMVKEVLAKMYQNEEVPIEKSDFRIL